MFVARPMRSILKRCRRAGSSGRVAERGEGGVWTEVSGIQPGGSTSQKWTRERRSKGDSSKGDSGQSANRDPATERERERERETETETETETERSTFVR